MSDNRTDNVVENDIAAVVDVGGSKAPKEEENFYESPEGDKVWVL